jgi:hypothetical protein
VTRFLTPILYTDVFVLFGSGQKAHVVERNRIRHDGGTTMARCGRKGRKVRLAAEHSTPANIVERHAVCQDCREFTRGTDG